MRLVGATTLRNMMRLKHAEIIPSPDKEGWTRLTGEVTYGDRPADTELYWFEVPDKWGEFLSESGNPWLACLLPLAVRLDEPLQIDRPVDRALFENVQQLMRIWKGWYPHLHIVPVEAEVVESGPRRDAARTVSFFSGGIDSFYTLLHSETAPAPHAPVDDLMTIWGFDPSLDNQTTAQNLRLRLQSIASDLGKEFVELATNLRATRFWQGGLKDYQDLSHGAFLASVGLALERRYDRVLISSTYNPGDLHPWGSHPLTDPLLSTGQTQVIHYGAEVSRLEKVALVAQSDVAMRTLRVCWYPGAGGNCGRCDKCHHTMLMLELHGALERCAAFEGKTLDLERIANKRDLFDTEWYFFEEIAAYAREQGRTDIADAVERSLRLTRANTWVQSIQRVRQWFEARPAIWRLLRPVRSVLRVAIEKVAGPVF
jgi:hypothetical protein